MPEPLPARDPVLPRHVAIIMDGNGRWAQARGLPRIAGHRAGVQALREIVTACTTGGIAVLTVYAFSTENWKRPMTEVTRLLDLFLTSLRKEIMELNRNNIRVRFIGDYRAFPEKLRRSMEQSQQQTSTNTGLQFVVAVNYGGRWDILNALNNILEKISSGELEPGTVDEALFNTFVTLSDLPPPDLFIRTGGEQRISNFLLWQLAYTELYFTECLWPDFSPEHLQEAFSWYAHRERRYGRTSEQLRQADRA